MILVNCAACAAPLAHDAPRCVRRKTRYCDSTCQHDHWRRGHKQICKKIHRGGNAEQYHADNKYKEAVAVAVEECADDTKGQKCYLCLEAMHPRTGEGLVRGCACGGRDGVSSPELGVVHVSCLARQAQILVEEAEENKLGGTERFDARWARWHTCDLCEQHYHGVVRCALGWACWKTYVGRSEADRTRRYAIALLGNGLYAAKHYEDALSVYESEFSMERRLGAPEENILAVQNNIASTYHELERFEEALRVRQDVYSGHLKLNGEEHGRFLVASSNYASSLVGLQRYEEAKSLLRKSIPAARRVFGTQDTRTLDMSWIYAIALLRNAGATLDDLREAVTTLEDTARTAQRVFGGAHPYVLGIEKALRAARAALHARETPPSEGA